MNHYNVIKNNVQPSPQTGYRAIAKAQEFSKNKSNGNARELADSVDVSLFKGADEKKEYKWTILIYSSATGDIDAQAVESIKDLEKTGSDENIAIVLQQSRKPYNSEAGWTGARRYFIVKNNSAGITSDPTDVSSPVLEELGKINPSDEKNLENFISWGMKKFPAERTMIVLGGHGAGFLGAISDPDKKKLMNMGNITSAIKKIGKNPDVIVFNSCLMSMAETAGEMAGQAGYMVASECDLKETGLPLGEFVRNLKEKTEAGSTISCLLYTSPSPRDS